jgi:hypothetical protein
LKTHKKGSEETERQLKWYHTLKSHCQKSVMITPNGSPE